MWGEALSLQLRRSLARWQRMLARIWARARWHWWGLLLWLARSPQLRFLPWPLPAATSLRRWKEDALEMVQRGTFPVRWLQKAVTLKAFTATNMALMTQIRNRMGLEFCFMEDDMLILGMRATRVPKGVRKKLTQSAVEEAQNTVPEDREKAARQMIGPRGGLPTLKQDLIRLAVLVHVPVLENDTVDKLKAKLMPVCKALAAKKPAKEAQEPAASSTAAPPTFAIDTPTENRRRRSIQEMESLSNQLRTPVPLSQFQVPEGSAQELESQSNQLRTPVPMAVAPAVVEVSQRLLEGQRELEEMELDLPVSEDMGFTLTDRYDRA